MEIISLYCRWLVCNLVYKDLQTSGPVLHATNWTAFILFFHFFLKAPRSGSHMELRGMGKVLSDLWFLLLLTGHLLLS